MPNIHNMNKIPGLLSRSQLFSS